MTFLQCKYNSALADKEESKELIKRQEVDILDLKEALRLRVLSEDIEVDVNAAQLFFFFYSSVCMFTYGGL
jgi:hypothetical protein